MKKVVLAITTLLTLSAAQATIPNSSILENNSAIIATEDEKVPVKLEDLPEAVTEALATLEGWAPSEAFLIKGEQSYYEITMKNEAGESTVVKMTKDGKQL